MKKKILGYEYKHGTLVNSLLNDRDDAIIVKEKIHFEDGTTKPNIRIIHNYQRPFYVVQEKFRTFKDKRTWFPKDQMKEYTCNQRQLNDTIVKVTRRGRSGSPLKALNRDPYLFGTDINATTLLKHEYQKRYGSLRSYYDIAHLDIEREIEGREADRRINMISISYKDYVYQVICKWYSAGIPDIGAQIQKKFNETVQPVLDALQENKKFKDKLDIPKYRLEIEEVEDEDEAVIKIFAKLHELMPDILSIWNLPYDTKKMMIALDRKEIDHKDIFNDPNIPRHLKYFKFTEGQAIQTDANGAGESKDPCDRWHKVRSPSSFFWADQMCARRWIRKHKPKEPSYKLGDILFKTFGFGKLYGDDSPENMSDGSPDWHKYMQKYRKVFYCVYNMFDNIGAQLLDMLNKDLAQIFPAQCNRSDLESYSSQGKKLSDDIYFTILEKEGLILAGSSDQMISELEHYSVPLDGWICTLASWLHKETMGGKYLKDFPDSFTKIVKFVLDIDVKSSYPSTGVWANISRETTRRVMCRIAGVDFEQQRRVGLNISSGKVNALMIVRTLGKTPTLPQMLKRFDAHYEANLKDKK